MPDCLIVVGMHRSGTSALTGALHRLGVAVGSDVVDTPDDNVPGYYEHSGVVALHEELLTACGSAWDDLAPRPWPPDALSPAVAAFKSALSRLLAAEFGDSPLRAIKDPRLCRTLELWLPVLAGLEIRPHVLLVHRPVDEVAASLARRNEFSVDKSSRLWIDHVLTSERASRGCPRSFVAFSDLLADPVQTLDRVSRQLGIDWPRAPAACAEELADFLDPSLRHNREGPLGTEARGSDLARELQTALSEAAENPSASAPFERLGAAHRLASSSIEPIVMEHLHQFSHRETAASRWTLKETLEAQLEGASERLGARVASFELAKDTLEAQLGGASERLGAGVASLELAIAGLRATQDSLAAELDAGSRLAQERAQGVESSLRHLTDVVSALEITVEHQETGLRTTRDSLAAELDAGSRLAQERAQGVERSLRHLTDVVSALETTVEHQESQLENLRRRLDRIQHELELEMRLTATQEALEYLRSRIDVLAVEPPETWWKRLVRRLRFWRSESEQGT